MPRTRVPPAERLVHLERVMAEKEPLRTIKMSPAWGHLLAIFDAELDLSEHRFRLGKETAEQHRAYLQVIEAVRVVVEESEEQIPQLVKEYAELEDHLKRQRSRRLASLPGS